MEEFQAESLVIISLGAFILPLLAQRIKIPGIVLEIAYGITVGPILGIVETSEFISGLAILGSLLLMFLSFITLNTSANFDLKQDKNVSSFLYI